MVRACCVRGCHSTGTTPSHVLPKNVELRKTWLENVTLKSYNESEIEKLRICYKHFQDSDYTGIHNRRLSRFAVPFMAAELSSDPSCEEEGTQNPCRHEEQNTENQSEKQDTQNRSEEEETQNRSKEEDTRVMKDIKSEQLVISRAEQQEDITILKSNITELQNNVAIVSENQDNQDNQVTELQRKVEKLCETQVQFHNDITQEMNHLRKKISKTCTIYNARPNLGRITRTKMLCPQARKLYDVTIKLQKQKRNLKRSINKLKQRKPTDRIILSTQSNKIDETKDVREQFIDMIVRNSSIPPQVTSHSKGEITY